jgi:hypothetical protein
VPLESPGPPRGNSSRLLPAAAEFKQLYADNALPQTFTSFASWKLPKETGATVVLTWSVPATRAANRNS